MSNLAVKAYFWGLNQFNAAKKESYTCFPMY